MAVFAASPKQFQIAQASRAAREKTKPFAEPIVTQLVMADNFYPAEAKL